MDPQQPLQQPMPEMNTMPPAKPSKVWMIIAILAVIILIGGGVYAFMKMQAYNTNVANLNTQVSDAKAQTATLQAANDAAAILKITEFGVQMPKPTDAKEVFYFVVKNTASNQVASFSSPGLQSLAAQNPSAPAVANACGLNSGALGTITKFDAGSLVKGVKIEEVKDTDVMIVKKQDVAYYVYNAPATQCSTVKVVQDLQTLQAKSVQEAFKSIAVVK
ncbi:hypothetical protein H0W80_04780 [Candidatus Saccharibacteria bacterium]|nr:hypothetical protein [Candidatus Saccharibacteria bacterium]